MKRLATFFTLAYLLSWLIWLPLYSAAWGWHLPVVPFHHALGGLGPLTAAFATAAWWEGRSGVQKLWRRCWQWQPWGWMAVALFSPFVLGGLAVLATSFLNETPLRLDGLLTSKEFPTFGFGTFFAYNLVFFGLGEEAGWRGFALPRLQQRFSPLAATLLLTVGWALWHWPLFFYRPGYTSMDISGVVGWLLSLLTGSVLLTWLYNGSRGSILICAVFHATVDIAFTADFADPAAVNVLGALITIWGIVVAVLLYFRKSGNSGIDSPQKAQKGTKRI